MYIYRGISVENVHMYAISKQQMFSNYILHFLKAISE